MSIPLLAGAKGANHALCGVCAREAMQIAYMPSNDFKRALWTCPECVKLLRDTYNMPPATLSEYESRALFAAAKKAAPDLIDAILTALWDKGVTDLSALSSETVDEIRENPPDEIKAAVTDALLTYAATMRAEIGSHNPPF